jgi:hypothetical protein
MLTKQGCTVGIIDAEALARINPVSGEATREIPEGWDAADAIDEPINSGRRSWTDLAALSDAALKTTPPTSIAEIKAGAASLNKDDKDGAKRLVKAATFAKADAIDKAQIIKALAKSLGVDKAAVRCLWRDVDSAMRIANAATRMDGERLRETERLAREAKRAELYERCKHIATNPDLLKHMLDLVRRMGVISERRGIIAAYIVAASRLHIRGAISLLRRGAAASGKNHLADAVLRLIPEESVITAISGSPKALAYYGGAQAEDALKNKVVYIPEAAAIADKGGVEGEFTTMLRVLISENRIVYQTVQTQENQAPITVTVVKNGPIAAIITSARDNIETEMMTRLMVADADESAAQTRAILENTLADRKNAASAEEIDSWVDFQRWLELGGPYDVAIPFLEAINRAYGNPVKAPPLRIRRDIAAFRNAIMASAIIHVAQRKRDERGRIVAEMSDYEAAHEAFDYDMGSLYAVNVPERAKTVVRAVEGMIEAERTKGEAGTGTKITRDALMTALGINSRDTASNRLQEAQRLGLIELVEPPNGLGKTTARRYKILIPSSETEGRKSGGVFPSPESVRGIYTGCTGWTVSSKGEGGPPCVSDEPSSDDTQRGEERVQTDGPAGPTGPISPLRTDGGSNDANVRAHSGTPSSRLRFKL